MTSRYQVVRSIAKGGMAEVFLARMTGEAGFAKTVALKRLPTAFAANEEVVRMLMDEARLAARLNHPQVVQVFDFGRDDAGYYIAMEYVDGPDLNTVLKYFRAKAEPPPESPMVFTMIQALRGLDYAHRLTDESGVLLGLVHRDVSPSNILVTADGVVKVSDFGIAKAQGRFTETRAGSLKGKLPYMSPEQARGKPLDQRTDILSAGLVLWECIVGRRCYSASGDADILRQAAYAEHETFSALGLAVDPELEEIVERALRRDPLERFETAGEMAQALEAYHRRAHPRFSPDELGNVVATVAGTPRSQSGSFVVVAGSAAGQPGQTLPQQPAAPGPRTGPTMGVPAGSKRVGGPPQENEHTDWGLGGVSEAPADEASGVEDTVSPNSWQPNPKGHSEPHSKPGIERSNTRPPSTGSKPVDVKAPATQPSDAVPDPAAPAGPAAKPTTKAKRSPTTERVPRETEKGRREQEKEKPPTEEAAAAAWPSGTPAPSTPPSGGLSAFKAVGLLLLTLAIGGGVFVAGSYFDKPAPGDPELVKSPPPATRMRGPPGSKGDATVNGGANLPVFHEPGEAVAAPPDAGVEHKGKGASAHAEAASGGQSPSEHKSKHPKEGESKVGEGKLDLTCQPECVVYLDGVQVGHSPLVNLTVPAGSHSLRMRNSETSLEKKSKLEILAGEHIIRNVNLVLDP